MNLKYKTIIIYTLIGFLGYEFMNYLEFGNSWLSVPRIPYFLVSLLMWLIAGYCFYRFTNWYKRNRSNR